MENIIKGIRQVAGRTFGHMESEKTIIKQPHGIINKNTTN